MTIQVQRNRSERFLKIKSVYTDKAIWLLTGDIFDKLQQRHSTYALEIVTLELEIINISPATASKRIFPFENQLFGYISHLLLNTCNFHRKFWLIFSLNLFENAQNVRFREAKFQNFPDPPSILAPSALDPISAGLTLNCFRQTCYYQWAIVSIILGILIAQKHVSFFTRKGCTFRIIQIDR